MKDIEIARSVTPKKINEVTADLGIPDEFVDQYGKYKGKISIKYMNDLESRVDGKVILVTAISPTPMGEGKTTISIGLADAMNKIGNRTILALREPSLGPVFGVKGGATGGGRAQIIPMEDINLHFTGDIHAITSANNLLSAMIDNHLYFGNKLGIKRVTWKRCVDLNDRALRKIQIGLSGEKRMVSREDGFDISVASEIMAIFCLATSLDDLTHRLGNIIIGYNEDDKPVYAKDLKAEGAMTVLLKEAFNPNVVQTLEGNPCLIHGGPFANIAHGCNSVVATKMAMKLRKYVVTEAGFGAELGMEKFIDIKGRNNDINADAVVCVATIKALKYHGGLGLDEVENENFDAIREGVSNLLHHVDNIKNKFNRPCIVAINRFPHDTEAEIELLRTILRDNEIEMSVVEAWEKGSDGAIELAEKVTELCEEKQDVSFAYNLEDAIDKKIYDVATKIYGAEGIEVSEEARAAIEKIESMGFGNLPICMSKNQYSFSDDAKNLKCEEPFKIHVKDVILRAGAGFLVVMTGNIFTMPGLPEVPSAEKIGLDDFENIEGIF